ncbi:uncharacterized protein LOC132624757 [Lycium barbarum]|uniref:uncharacterized protein LOC132624757 n=1 Tax=Lycium barbarum TaxID=112863 RepID=UPI00293EE7FE|nr:uncharacterized protein LOC132624757 [Lycium barbarum]
MSETSHDVPSVSSPGAEAASPAKSKSTFEPTASDIIPAMFNFNKDLKAEKPSSVSDRGYDVRRYPSSIIEEKLDIVRADCGWDTRPSVVLVNEAFIRAQQEINDLRGQLDAQGRETEKYQHLLQEKEDELNRAAALSNLRPELDAAKDENRILKSELAAMADYNRSLEADKIGLSRDKAQFFSRLDELEITVSQLRGELDSVKADAIGLAERNRLLESEAAQYKDRMRVFEEKAEERSWICEGLRVELEEAVSANDALKAEQEAATGRSGVLEENRVDLESKLAKAEADLEEAWKSVEADEAHTAIVAEYEK